MSAGSRSASVVRLSLACAVLVGSFALVAAFTRSSVGDGGTALQDEQVDMQKVLRGRQLVLEHACSACHGGALTPDLDGWMVGVTESRPDLEFLIGPCAFEKGAEPCFRTRPRNLTPDNLTGMGRFTERQIFNALRYGLRPGETEDVEITSSTPGEGNFPANPKYLAPPMPWLAWRHMPDDDLWAIAAYLKNGVRPVRNVVEDSEGPPDFWVEGYEQFSPLNPMPVPPFPTTNEVRPTEAGVDLQQVLRGRQVVIQHDCGACHGGATNPAGEGWLAGSSPDVPGSQFPAWPPGDPPISGPCSAQPADVACWMMRPRNLTPHATGIGGYTDRQLFNAIRYGLRPSTTPDVEITSTDPGHGNFPENPDYLGLGMPWPAWRHMADEDIRAVIAYLRHGVKPVENEVAASDAPADLWASTFTVENIGPYPAPPFPTANEVGR